jgi:hypothetical protein
MTQSIEKIELGGNGIKSILKKYKPEQAIAEYIWNGFDAQATEINIDFEELNNLGGLSKITISDNGKGIPQDLLNQKFKPFFESEKAKTNPDGKHHSLTHGKNGRGRLTFFTFASQSTWTTTFQKDKKYFEYDIEVSTTNLENFTGSNTKLRDAKIQKSGTIVSFDGIRELTKDHLLGQITDYLKQEFGWFLEMYKSKNFSININGKPLEYEDIIGDREKTKFTHQETNTVFEISFIRWNQSLKNEYSRFYLINSDDNEIWKDTTKLNNQGDSFYHSIYVKSLFFDNFTYDSKQKEEEQKLLGKSKNDDAYKFLEEELTNYLRKKRKPFLKEFAKQLVEEYEKEGIIPEFKDDWEQPRKTELEEIVKGLYQIQPKIFNASSIEQKKTFVLFLNALLESDEREQILKIVGEVVDLDSSERKELLNLLQTTKLSGIIRTIKLITDRYKVVDQLKDIVFKKDLKANERDHIQKMIDEHYWLFGEQYHLVTTTEAKFETALRSYIYLLNGEDEKTKIDHADKNKEMDIFLCRQNKLTDTIENIVVELKSPSINLGKKEVDQVLTYMQVILKQPEFNAKNMLWEFYLVGNKFDTSGWIEQLIENKKEAGESKKGLIHSVGNYKIYVKTWSEIFTDFECRHKFLEEKLVLERDNLSKDYQSADQALQESKNLTK